MASSFLSSLTSLISLPWTTSSPPSSSSPDTMQSTSPPLHLLPPTAVALPESAPDQTLLCVFRLLDQNRDGFVSVREICEGLHRLGVDIPHPQMSDLLSLGSSSGLLSFAQFEALYISLCANPDSSDVEGNDEDVEHVGNAGNHGHADHPIDSNPKPDGNANLKQQNEDFLLLEAFRVYDKNADGYISLPELRTVLCGMGFSMCRDVAVCRKIIERVDKNGDGRLDFSEFKSMMLKHDGNMCHA